MELKDNSLTANDVDDLNDNYKTLMEWLVTMAMYVKYNYCFTGLVNVVTLRLHVVF